MTVCIPICATSLAELEQLSRRASELADVVELRLDYLAPPELSIDRINSLVTSLSSPVILTFRPESQGGFRALTDAERISFWKDVTTTSQAKYWDLEADLLPLLPFAVDRSRVIASHHNFEKVPDDLDQVVEEIANTRAATIKIAVHAGDIVDCLPVFKLIELYRAQDRQIIAIAMDHSGLATRILGPSRGSFLTYAALDSGKASAPGQLTAEQLKSIYRIDEITPETLIYGLAGSPVMQSVSPHMHNAAFVEHNLPGVYLPFEVRDVEQFVRRMVHPRTRELNWRLNGLSVTAPHKVAVMECVDWISPEADEIGAVNTLVVEADRLLGYNTDAAGLLEPLLRRFPELSGLKVAILGAGGVAKSAAWALQREGANVTVLARDVAKAEVLAERFDVLFDRMNDASLGEFDLVINATPLGSFGKYVEQSPVTSEQLAGVRCAYDLIYNPLDTLFIKRARAAGCETIGGLEMLVAQARLQFQLWTGTLPSPEVMFDAALSLLSRQP